MSDHPPDSPAPPTHRGIVFHSVLLSLALLCVFPFFAWYGYSTSGTVGLWAASIAALLCWVSSLAALLAVGLTRGTPLALQATLLGMFFRMGLPLGVGLALQRSGGELARAGVFAMILCYYLWALLIETFFVVRLVSTTGHKVAKV